MGPLPELNERDLSLLVRYSLESDEEMAEGVVNAFLAAGLDVYNQDTALVDWINPEVFEHCQWRSDQPLYLCTRIWNHGVVLTAEEIRIYRGPTLV